MSLLPESPLPKPKEEPALKAATGPWGGPSYSYRGATIHCGPGGHVCGFTLQGHPLSGRSSFGVVGTITPLIDVWLDTGRLPPYLRAVDPGAT